MAIYSSTQLMQMAIDTQLQAFSQASHLSFQQLQDALTNPKSPMHAIYETLMDLQDNNQFFENFFTHLNQEKLKLTAKKISLEQDLQQYPGMPHDLQQEYDQQLVEVAQAMHLLESLEQDYRLIEGAALKARAQFTQTLNRFSHDYTALKETIREAFIKGGNSRYEEKNLYDTLAYLANFNKGAQHG